MTHKRVRPDNFRVLRRSRRTVQLLENMLVLLDALPAGQALPVDPLLLKADGRDSYLVLDQDRQIVGSVMFSGVGQFKPDNRWRWAVWDHDGRLPPFEGWEKDRDAATRAFREAWGRKK